MVTYIFFIAVLNIGLGFALAVYLAHCYRRMLADRDVELTPACEDFTVDPDFVDPPEEAGPPAAEIAPEPSSPEQQPAEPESVGGDSPSETPEEAQSEPLAKIPDAEYAKIIDSLTDT